MQRPLLPPPPAPSRQVQTLSGSFSIEKTKRRRRRRQREHTGLQWKKRRRSRLRKSRRQTKRRKLRRRFSSRQRREPPQRLQKLRRLRFRQARSLFLCFSSFFCWELLFSSFPASFPCSAALQLRSIIPRWKRMCYHWMIPLSRRCAQRWKKATRLTEASQNLMRMLWRYSLQAIGQPIRSQMRSKRRLLGFTISCTPSRRRRKRSKRNRQQAAVSGISPQSMFSR